MVYCWTRNNKKEMKSQGRVMIKCKKFKLLGQSWEICTSPPSSKTNTSPCSNGDIVPASVFR